jgi:hypothetical protein
LYAWKKIQKFKCNKDLAFQVIILDDAVSSELTSKNNTGIIQLSKICRNMIFSFAVCFQTVRDRIKGLKSLIDDVFLYRYVPYADLELDCQCSTYFTLYQSHISCLQKFQRKIGEDNYSKPKWSNWGKKWIMYFRFFFACFFAFLFRPKWTATLLPQ